MADIAQPLFPLSVNERKELRMVAGALTLSAKAKRAYRQTDDAVERMHEAGVADEAMDFGRQERAECMVQVEVAELAVHAARMLVSSRMAAVLDRCERLQAEIYIDASLDAETSRAENGGQGDRSDYYHAPEVPPLLEIVEAILEGQDPEELFSESEDVVAATPV